MAKNRSKKVAFLFGEGGTSKEKLGGKGAALSEMIAAGMRVPLGFTITTSVARAFAQHASVPKRLRNQITWGLDAIEKNSGKRFGDATNPLLVSVRSGAAISMPGMMDTVLNLGINPEIAAALAAQTDKRFAYDCYRRFLQMFAEVVQGIDRHHFEDFIARMKADRKVRFDSELTGDDWQEACECFRAIIVANGKPLVDDAQEQLTMAIDAVLVSWNSPRAVEYRAAKGISNSLGTAVNVQAMVYGNRDDQSATGVAFSRNTATGAAGFWGEFLVRAQGEDVVSGVRTPTPLQAMAQWNKPVADELEAIVIKLEKHYGYVVDIEFTVETGVLYILQVRRAKLSPEAAVTVAINSVWSKQASKSEAVATVTDSQVEAVSAPSFSEASLKTAAAPVAVGLVACPGAIVGTVVHTSEAAVAAAAAGRKVVLVRPDTSPDDLPGMIAAAAIVTETGGYTSHAAVVARDLGKPCVVGCGPMPVMYEGLPVSLDANAGKLYRGTLKLVEPVKKKEVNIFLRWYAEEMGRKVPAPRLVFELVDRPVQVPQMLNDFYLLEHLVGATKGSALAGDAGRLRTRVHVEVAERLAMYLTVAVGGEIRHADKKWAEEDYSQKSDYWKLTHRTSMPPADPSLKALLLEYKVQLDGEDRQEAQVVHTNRLKTMTHAQHVRFLQLCTEVFNNGRWMGSMGGNAWGKISAAAHAFLTGKMTHTGFSDHAFDLQHNNGTVFGKNDMLSGNRYEVQARLDLKKHATGIVDLYRKLSNPVHFVDKTDWRREVPRVAQVGFSPEVEALYRKGLRAGLWS